MSKIPAGDASRLTVESFAPPRLATVKRATLKDQSYEALRRALLAGRFEPGRQLTIRHLADQLGAGVMPVREAVRSLVAEGALAGLPTGRVSVPRLTREAFEEILELRLLLEPLSAEKAARRGGPEFAGALLEHEMRLEEAMTTADPPAVLWANYQFHFAVYTHADSDLLAHQIETLWLRNGPMLIGLFETPQISARFMDEGAPLHRALCDAIAAKDGRAARVAMTTVILKAAEVHLDCYPFAE